MALKFLHDECEMDDVKGLIHGDIKLSNIVTNVCHKNLYLQLQEIVSESKISLEPFRMICQKNRKLEKMDKRRKTLEKYFNELPSFDSDESKTLTFKLIDFGSAKVSFLLLIRCKLR